MSYKEKLDAFEKEVSNWTAEEREAHLEKIEKYYASGTQVNLLGDFSFDPSHIFHWHTYDDNPMKLERRRQIGWRFADREDARKAGIEDRRTAEATILGDSCVEMSCGDCQAVLLKIPRALHDLNLAIKERLKKSKPKKDRHGKTIKEHQISDDGTNVVLNRDEGTIN